jgi:hypothetical protein
MKSIMKMVIVQHCECITTHYTLKVAKMVHFMLCVFYHNFLQRKVKTMLLGVGRRSILVRYLADCCYLNL